MNRVLIERIAGAILSDPPSTWEGALRVADTIVKKLEAEQFRVDDLNSALAIDHRFYRACKTIWPTIRTAEAIVLELLLSRDFVSIEAISVSTRTTSADTPKVWVSRLRSYTKVKILNTHKCGYSMHPDDRKALKEKINA